MIVVLKKEGDNSNLIGFASKNIFSYDDNSYSSWYQQQTVAQDPNAFSFLISKDNVLRESWNIVDPAAVVQKKGYDLGL